MDDRLDILILCADSHRWDAMGCAADGSRQAEASWLTTTCNGRPLVQTPHLDTLASRAVRFRQAVTNQPLCLPSRQSFITGIYPHELGTITNHHYWPAALPVPTLGEYLQQAGYVTAAMGNMHWKATRAPREHVADSRGFDTRFTYADCRTEEPAQGDYRTWIGPETSAIIDRERKPAGSGASKYIGGISHLPADQLVEAWLADRAVQFIEDLDHNQRFCLIYSVDRPHPGSFIPREYDGMYPPGDMPLPPVRAQLIEDDPSVPRQIAAGQYQQMTTADRQTAVSRYLANVSYMDHCMGQVLDALQRSGRADRTLVIYLSDHGECLGERCGLYAKENLYESALRVPFLVHWPGVTDLRHSDAPVELVDLMPTCLDAAGISPPEYLAGRSVKPLLNQATSPTTWRDATLSMQHQVHPDGSVYHQWVIREQRFKLIERSLGRSALYDLHHDFGETQNLIDDPASQDIYQRLRGQLLQRLTQRATIYPAQILSR